MFTQESHFYPQASLTNGVQQLASIDIKNFDADDGRYPSISPVEEYYAPKGDEDDPSNHNVTNFALNKLNMCTLIADDFS